MRCNQPASVRASVTEFIIEMIRQGGLVGIFVLMALENIFPPMPSEIIMGFAGVLVGRGELAFWPVLIIGTIGTTAGNGVWYWMGRSWSEQRLRRFIARFGRWLTMEWEDFERARRVFRRHGDWVVLVFRVSPIMRTIISLPAGVAQMKLWRFVLVTFAGSLVWNGALLAGGRLLTDFFAEYQTLAGLAVGGFLALGMAWYLWRVWRWKPRSQR